MTLNNIVPFIRLEPMTEIDFWNMQVALAEADEQIQSLYYEYYAEDMED